ncbi:MAG: hypothetical protein ABSB22_12690 [Thermodesulfobacteriota bacterium]|jgi:hypothetical protein
MASKSEEIIEGLKDQRRKELREYLKATPSFNCIDLDSVTLDIMNMSTLAGIPRNVVELGKYARAKLLTDPKSHQTKRAIEYLRDITGLAPEEYEDPIPDEMLTGIYFPGIRRESIYFDLINRSIKTDSALFKRVFECSEDEEVNKEITKKYFEQFFKNTQI